jgi:hypothetical protein
MLNEIGLFPPIYQTAANPFSPRVRRSGSIKALYINDRFQARRFDHGMVEMLAGISFTFAPAFRSSINFGSALKSQISFSAIAEGDE